jgi:hypothetical protein
LGVRELTPVVNDEEWKEAIQKLPPSKLPEGKNVSSKTDYITSKETKTKSFGFLRNCERK